MKIFRGIFGRITITTPFLFKLIPGLLFSIQQKSDCLSQEMQKIYTIFNCESITGC